MRLDSTGTFFAYQGSWRKLPSRLMSSTSHEYTLVSVCTYINRHSPRPGFKLATQISYTRTMILLKNIIAYFVLGLVALAPCVLATSFAMTRCYCVSDTEMGWVNIYNLTESASRSIVWYRNGTVPRDDFDYPDMCGKECNADRSECWSVPCKSPPC